MSGSEKYFMNMKGVLHIIIEFQGSFLTNLKVKRSENSSILGILMIIKCDQVNLVIAPSSYNWTRFG